VGGDRCDRQADRQTFLPAKASLKNLNSPLTPLASLGTINHTSQKLVLKCEVTVQNNLAKDIYAFVRNYQLPRQIFAIKASGLGST